MQYFHTLNDFFFFLEIHISKNKKYSSIHRTIIYFDETKLIIHDSENQKSTIKIIYQNSWFEKQNHNFDSKRKIRTNQNNPPQTIRNRNS